MSNGEKKKSAAQILRGKALTPKNILKVGPVTAIKQYGAAGRAYKRGQQISKREISLRKVDVKTTAQRLKEHNRRMQGK